jgi:hypothetical protein
VGVAVHRDRDRGVAQAFLYDLGVNPARQRQCGPGMPKCRVGVCRYEKSLRQG